MTNRKEKPKVKRVVTKNRGNKRAAGRRTVRPRLQRDCLLILGMHRSGTSALTRVLNVMGASLPRNIMGAGLGNEDGHWESETLVTYHDQLLEKEDSHWHDWQALRVLPSRQKEAAIDIQALVESEYGPAPLFVLKDPRICRFVPIYLEALKGAGIAACPVMIFRNPLDVIDSLRRRAENWGPKFTRADAALLWLRYVLEAEHATRGMARTFLSFEDLLEDWRGVVTRVQETFNLPFMPMEEIGPEIDAFISPDKRHHARRTVEIVLDPLLRDWVGEAWEAYLLLTRNPKSKTAMARLDRVAEAFNGASPVLQAFFEEVHQEHGQETGKLSDAIAQKEKDLEALAEAKSQLEASLSERGEAVSQLQVEWAALNEQVAAMEARVAAQQEEISALRQLSSDKDEVISARDKVVAEMERALQHMQEQLDQAKGEAGQLEATLAKRGEEVAALREELDARVSDLATAQQQMADKDRALDDIKTILAERDAALAAREESLKEKEQALESLREEFEQAQTEAGQLESTLAKRGEEVAALREELDARVSDLATAQQQMADKDRALSTRDQMLEDLSKKKSELEQNLGELRRDVQHARAAQAAAEAQQEEFKKSKSWRMTAPLRKISRLFRGSLLKRFGTTKPFVLSPQGVAGQSNEVLALQDSSRAQLSDIFVFAIIGWRFRFQRPQHLARELSRMGHRVFYIEMEMSEGDIEVEELEPSLFRVRMSPRNIGLVQPYVGLPTADQQLAWIKAFYQFCESIQATPQKEIVVQHPYWWNFLKGLPPEFRIVYDCMDDVSEFENVSESLIAWEHDLLEGCDLLIVSSEHLKQKYGKLKPATLIRNAGQYDHFALEEGKGHDIYPFVPVRTHPGTTAKVGYVGAISVWFDSDILIEVARMRRDIEFHLAGDVTCPQARRLDDEPNVHMYGEIAYEDVPSFNNSVDVLTIPFRITPLIEACDPVKFYEHCALGKPTVSTPLPELSRVGDLVLFAETAEDFSRAIDRALISARQEQYIARLKAFAAENTWAMRAKDFQNIILSSYPKISIIILSYGNPELTKGVVSSLFQPQPVYPNMEILVVDNGSSDGAIEDIQQYIAPYENIRLIKNGKNLGFAAGNNIGIRQATGEYVMLLNNDTFVTPGAIFAMMRALRDHDKVGAVGPLTNNIGNEQKLFIDYSDMQEMRYQALEETVGYRGKISPIRTLAYFAVMFRKRDLDERFGHLCEDYQRGMFEDDDHCAKIRSLGYECVIAEDAFIHHHLSATFSQIDEEERKLLFEKNKKIFEKKWGPWVPHQYRERPERCGE